MDVFAIIKARHDETRQVAHLILQTDSTAVDIRKGKFTMLYNEIVAHHATEENIVVPVLNKVESMKAMGEDILEDHREIRAILEDLKMRDFSDGQWMMKFEVAHEKMESHMKEEEQEISMEAHKLFDGPQLDQLGEEFIREEKNQKEKLLAELSNS